MKPWYSKLGPLSWYRGNGRLEWIELSFEVFERWFSVRTRMQRGRVTGLTIVLGAIVTRRSMFGTPGSFERGRMITWQRHAAYLCGELMHEKGWRTWR